MDKSVAGMHTDAFMTSCASCNHQIPSFDNFQDLMFEHEHFLQSVDMSSRDEIELHELTAPLPTDESDRMRTLRELRILDSEDEECYDRYVSLIKRYFRLPIAFLSFVDLRRTWFKASIGLTKGWKEASRNVSFCSYTVLDESPEVFMIPDTLQDPRFTEHPFVLNEPHIRFYVGACVRVQGMKVGSLCLMDIHPNTSWTEDDQLVLLDIAKVIGNMLEERRRMILHVESEKAKILLSVFYMLKRPILELNDSYSSMEALFTLWKYGEQPQQLPSPRQKQQQDGAASVTSRSSSSSYDDSLSSDREAYNISSGNTGTSFPVWKEKIDTWSSQCQTFATRLELTLRVIHRLLLGNQSNPTASVPSSSSSSTAAIGSFSKPKLCPCSVYELIKHMKSYVPVFNQQMEKQVLFSKFALEFPRLNQVATLSEIYSHPDVIILLSLTLLAHLHQHDYTGVSVQFDFQNNEGGVDHAAPSATTPTSSSSQYFNKMQATSLIDFSNTSYCATHTPSSKSPPHRAHKRKWDISTNTGNGIYPGMENVEEQFEGWYQTGHLHITFTAASTWNPAMEMFDGSSTSSTSSTSYEILALKHAIHFVGGQFHAKKDITSNISSRLSGDMEVAEELGCYELLIPAMMKRAAPSQPRSDVMDTSH